MMHSIGKPWIYQLSQITQLISSIELNEMNKHGLIHNNNSIMVTKKHLKYYNGIEKYGIRELNISSIT